MSWNPVIEMGMFTDAGSLYPKVVTLNVNFGVLHEYDRGFFARPEVDKEGTKEEEPPEDIAPFLGDGDGETE